MLPLCSQSEMLGEASYHPVSSFCLSYLVCMTIIGLLLKYPERKSLKSCKWISYLWTSTLSKLEDLKLYHKQGFKHQIVTSFYSLRLLGNNMNQKYFILMPPCQHKTSSLNTDIKFPENLISIKNIYILFLLVLLISSKTFSSDES